MSSAICAKAINDALQSGNAMLKFISPNDVNATGAHQAGFYLPKSAWEIFTPHSPTKGQNAKHSVKIEWQGGYLTTESVVTWYGQGTRSEYRLTRFGRDFPFLIPDSVGDLLVLVPKSLDEFNCYVLDLEDDIEEIIAALGVQPFDYWATYKDGVAEVEDKDDCVEKRFNKFAQKFDSFPSGQVFSDTTRKILSLCFQDIEKQTIDDQLLEYYLTEYRLFQVLERQICQSEIGRLFKDVNDFLNTAASIMNRRKSRAGRSLENHVDYLLKSANIPHEMRPNIEGKPDIVIPDKVSYFSSHYPLEKLFIVGVKTTCKDRWRQVLNEATKVRRKHILTLQPGISFNQLNEMHKAGITLIVPRKLHRDYPQKHSINILTLEDFVAHIKEVL